MTALKKFLFNYSFDVVEEPEEEEDEIVEEIEEPEEIVPTFSEEDLKAARQEGFSAGKEEGVKEASDAVEHQIMETLAAIGKRMNDLFSIQLEANTATERNALSVAATIVRKIFPATNQRHALDEVENLVNMAMGQVIEEPRVVVRVNDQIRDPLAGRIEALCAEKGLQEKMVLMGDANIPLGDCRIEWSSGGAVRDTAALWREIDGIIERNLGGEEDSAQSAAESSVLPSAEPPPEPAGTADAETPPSPAETTPTPSGAGDGAAEASTAVNAGIEEPDGGGLNDGEARPDGDAAAGPAGGEETADGPAGGEEDETGNEGARDLPAGADGSATSETAAPKGG